MTRQHTNPTEGSRVIWLGKLIRTILDEQIVVLDQKRYRAYLKVVPIRLGKDGAPVRYAVRPFIRLEEDKP
jgi:hypothetical protein